MITQMIEKVRAAKPLVHAVTNYVTINDVANAVIACGASPIMTDQPLAMPDVIKASDGLALNLGSPLKPEDIETAAHLAQAAHKLVVLDPVGVTAVPYKNNLTHQLIDAGLITVLKGNASEIKTLLSDTATGQGVDSMPQDLVSDKNLDATIHQMKNFAKEKEIILILTGEIDVITDGRQTALTRNGNPMMETYTGAGCQLNGVITAFLAAAESADYFEAAVAAVVAYTVAGDIAFEHLQPHEGNATYRNRVIDSLFLLEKEELERRANFEIR